MNREDVKRGKGEEEGEGEKKRRVKCGLGDGDTRPVGWVFPAMGGVYDRVLPELRWERMPTEIPGVGGALVSELENWHTRLALSLIRYDDLPALARQDWLRPLDAWFKPGDLAAYSPQALAMCTLGGRLYAIPDDITPFVFYVKVSLLRRFRLDPPRTWEEMEVFLSKLAAARRPLFMLNESSRFREGFLTALLGSNGVAPVAGAAMMKDGRRAIEAYEWIRRMALDRRVIPPEDLTPRRVKFSSATRKNAPAGFAWLSMFAAMPAAQQRRYVFLPFPRGPSLAAGELPWAPVKGACWCMPWSQVSPDIPVGVLRRIHSPATQAVVEDVYRTPYLAIRARWDDPAVRRRYPLYASAASLVDGIRPIPREHYDQVQRLEITFRNALLAGWDGQRWLDAYSGVSRAQVAGGPPPMRTVVRAIDTRLADVRGVGEIARSLGLHPVRLRRLMLRELHEGAGTYFRARRLETARNLLVSGDLKVNEAATRVGYRSVAAFCRAYRKRYGRPPKADRNRGV